MSESSPQLKDQNLTTKRPAREFPRAWTRPGNTRPAMPSPGPTSSSCATSLTEKGGKRTVELLVAPMGDIRYTLDGSEPRDGMLYERPVDIGDGEVLLRVFAEAPGLEAKAEFRFPARGKKGVQIDEVKPGRLVSRTGRKLDSRTKTFEGLKQAAREIRHL